MLKVGIVMPTINLWAKYTKPAIDSVSFAMKYAKGGGVDSEFLLIDNGSTDETPEKALELTTALGFHYHRNNDMWGFQRSVNFGVKHFFDRGFDVVLVLNNDIVLHSAAVERLAERFKDGSPFDGKPVGMVTCMDVTGECENDPHRLEAINDLEKRLDCSESGHPHFSAFAVGKECWETVGEFDELFAPAYYEDNDYHHRMKLAGVEAVCYPPAMFFHYGSRTQTEALGRPFTHSENQHAQFVRKWGGDPGREVFSAPFNDPSKAIKSTKQGS